MSNENQNHATPSLLQQMIQAKSNQDDFHWEFEAKPRDAPSEIGDWELNQPAGKDPDWMLELLAKAILLNPHTREGAEALISIAAGVSQGTVYRKGQWIKVVWE